MRSLLFSFIVVLVLFHSAFSSPSSQLIDELAHPHPIPPSAVGPVLRAALVITRHGDRTPIKTFPNTKSHWPEGLGQLTWLGMEQHYELGQMFRKRYVEEHGLVSPEYRGNEVYVRSTSKERTLMSAQSFMHGFYPPTQEAKRLPGGLQPVPIHAFAKHHDNVLYAYKNCPRIKEMQELVKQGSEWRAMEEKTAELRTHLSKLLGTELGLKHFTSVATLLKQEIVHNKTMIDGFPLEHLDTIKSVGEWVLKQKYATREMGKLGSGRIFTEILGTLRPHLGPATAATDSPKFMLLSAHDGTLLALLTALNIPNFHVPPFAAYVAFELYTWPDEHNGERAFVQLVYNGEPLTLPGCSGQAEGNCTFAEFEKVLAESTSLNWYESCGAEICFEKDAGDKKKDKGAKKSKQVEQNSAPQLSSDAEPPKKLKHDESHAAKEGAGDGLRIGGLEYIMLATGFVLGLGVGPLKSLLFSSAPSSPAGRKSKRAKSSSSSSSAPTASPQGLTIPTRRAIKQQT